MGKPILTICIPTLNRQDWAIQAIKSVRLHQYDGRVALAISNNSSETSYDDLRRLLSDYTAFDVQYYEHSVRLSIDEHMHYVVSMADTEYVYLLGDDDYFEDGGLEYLLQIIDKSRPDLVLCANSANAPRDVSDLISYKDVSVAFWDLRYEAPFGSVLVKKSLLDDQFFLGLYGSAHAYDCFWVKLFWKGFYGEDVLILRVNKPCVFMRAEKKSYSALTVLYRQVLDGHEMRKSMLPASVVSGIYAQHEADYIKKITRFRILLFTLHDTTLSRFKEVSPEIWRRFKVRIFFISCILPLYPILKKIKNVLSGRVYAGNRPTVG